MAAQRCACTSRLRARSSAQCAISVMAITAARSTGRLIPRTLPCEAAAVGVQLARSPESNFRASGAQKPARGVVQPLESALRHPDQLADLYAGGLISRDDV